jgi:hypothetical protein
LEQGKLTGAKPPLRPKHVWSIWTTLQIEGRARDLTMFNLAIDSKLRGSKLAHERPLCARSSRSCFGYVLFLSERLVDIASDWTSETPAEGPALLVITLVSRLVD